MGRNNSDAWNTIRSFCLAEHIDEKILYKKSKMILEAYRSLCWQTLNNANDTIVDLCFCASSDIDGALIYLETFAPEREKDLFESRIKNLFDIRWLVNLVDSAMVKTRDFPIYGDEYAEIISKSFLTRWKYKESDLLEIFRLERSRFYDKKKEAIMLFGISLFGTAIPRFRDLSIGTIGPT